MADVVTRSHQHEARSAQEQTLYLEQIRGAIHDIQAECGEVLQLAHVLGVDQSIIGQTTEIQNLVGEMQADLNEVCQGR